MRHRVAVGMVGVGSALVFAGCGDSAGPSAHRAARLTAQNVAPVGCTAGLALPVDLVVRVTDSLGRPVGGVLITFAVVAGSGSLSATSATSTADGYAAVSFNCDGPNGTVEASAVGVSQPATFTIITNPGPPTLITATGGDNQSGQVGVALPLPLTARLTDAYSNPAPGAPVVWTVTSGGGALSPGATTSDLQGTVSATWTLGPTVGPQTVTVAIPGGASVSFSAAASP